MSEQAHYLCNKLDEIKQLDEYQLYILEQKKLKENSEYQSKLKKVVTYQIKNDEYFELKRAIIKDEKKLREYEKILNSYLNTIIKCYNSLIT